jgi:branched-chain amino acid transport system permease protein
MVVMMIWKPRGLVRIKRPAFFPSSMKEGIGSELSFEGKAEAGR